MTQTTKLLYAGILLTSGFLAGAIAGKSSVPSSEHVSQADDLATFVSKLPRGGMDIPAQWFEMQSAVGWEKMMLVLGYADNRSICEHLLAVASNESPDRVFTCNPAN